MEIDDLDLDLDPVAGFFQAKLEYVKSVKDEMKDTVQGLNGLLEKLRKDAENLQESRRNVKVVRSWKKICGGKFVFGYEIANQTGELLTDLSVSLEFNPAISPLYSSSVYSNSGQTWSNSIDESGQLIISVEKPTFLKHTVYHSSAVLVYKSPQSTSQLKLPAMRLAVEDFSRQLEIKSIDLISGDDESFLSVLACYSHKQLFAHCAANLQRSLVNYFVIDCMLREIKFRDTNYFLVDEISDSIDGIILELRQDEQENVSVLTIYYKFEESLHHILHYLHRNIRSIEILAHRPGQSREVSVVPTEEFLSQKPREIDTDVQRFGECLQNQIDAMANFQEYVVGNPHADAKRDLARDYRNLRQAVSQNEMETDLLFERLNPTN